MYTSLNAMVEHLHSALGRCDRQDFVIQEVLKRAIAMVGDRDLDCHLLAVLWSDE